MCGERLDKVISRLMPEYSRSRIQQWIDDGFVTVDGKSGKGKQAVLGHEVLIIEPQTSVQDLAFEAEDIPLNVVFEDDTLIVIHKPAGMVVHPAAGNWARHIAERVAAPLACTEKRTACRYCASFR
jgi:23S rRNA pseudouridine1911/1915/1917 synthase